MEETFNRVADTLDSLESRATEMITAIEEMNVTLGKHLCWLREMEAIMHQDWQGAE